MIDKRIRDMPTEIRKENKMGHAPMFKLIVSMSLPAIFSMTVQALYNIVDSIFVSHYSENGLVALTLALPIQLFLIALGVGTGVGINSLIARRLGERNFKEADSAATHGLLLAVMNWMIVALVGILLTKPFLLAYEDDPEVIMMGCQYLYTITIFSFGVFIQINCEKMLQATGNMIYPMLFQLVGAITNIILDPIFIFGYFGIPEMGVLGAAVATVIGQCVSMSFCLYVVFVKEHEVKISFKGFRFDPKIIKKIYQVGFPSIIMQSIASILLMGMNGILAGFSSTAVAVMGVYFRLQSFVFMPVFGLTQGIMPIMGYNYGAHNKTRLLSAMKIGGSIACCFMLLGTILFLLIPGPLMILFNASEDLMSMGTMALRIISVGFILAAMGITISVFFQAIGKGINSLLISVLRQLFVVLPVAYLLAPLGVNYVWWSFPIAEVVATAVSFLLFKMTYDKQIRNLDKL